MTQTKGLRRMDIGRLPLALGGELADVSIAYMSYGTLNPSGDNAVLVTHGLTSGAGMLEQAGGAEGSWAQLLGPGRALDSSRYFVVCSNVVGSAFGSTGPACVRAGTTEPWGPGFPPLTISDMVSAQKALLERLGVTRLRMVAGPSFGGMQALQWALDHPAWVGSAASVVSAPHWPAGMSAEELLRRFERDPEWHGGRYVPGRDMIAAMQRLRVETLVRYGAERLLEDFGQKGDAPALRRIEEAAWRWAETFDPHALLALQRAGERFDVRPRLAEIRCPVLFAPSSSDLVFPPDEQTRTLLRQALGERLRWREISTPYGHLASGVEIGQWEPCLKRLLQTTEPAKEQP
ncbi:alpha/beta fold hydrolase [Achromobacter denitrificans]